MTGVQIDVILAVSVFARVRRAFVDVDVTEFTCESCITAARKASKTVDAVSIVARHAFTLVDVTLAVLTHESHLTLTRVASHCVSAGGIVLTWVRIAFINFPSTKRSLVPLTALTREPVHLIPACSSVFARC